MENYEQKYKEALSWAHSAIKAGADGMLKEDLERIFPELRESEDEIMKEVIYNLIVSNDCTASSKEIFSVYEKTKEDCISWLEKQAVQKSWSEEDEQMIRSIRCYLNEFGNWLSDKNEEKSQSIYKACDWLKSIKPNHWKPSEYDISLLEEIARNIRNNIRPFCSEVSSLEDLIKNLKTLLIMPQDKKQLSQWKYELTTKTTTTHGQNEENQGRD